MFRSFASSSKLEYGLDNIRSALYAICKISSFLALKILEFYVSNLENLPYVK